MRNVLTTPLSAVAEDGIVFVDGETVAFNLPPEAAVALANSLIAAASEARAFDKVSSAHSED